jgi:hypothetical protein
MAIPRENISWAKLVLEVECMREKLEKLVEQFEVFEGESTEKGELAEKIEALRREFERVKAEEEKARQVVELSERQAKREEKPEFGEGGKQTITADLYQGNQRYQGNYRGDQNNQNRAQQHNGTSYRRPGYLNGDRAARF